MRKGRHAADDGSFGRSGGMAAGRAVALLSVAVVIGIVLLNAADDSPSPRVSAGGDKATSTSSPEQTTTTIAVTTTTTPARAPKEVKVLSANGTDVKGAARKATDALRAAGYNVLAPVDAGKKVSATSVFFAAGFEAEARAVASLLGLGPDVVKAIPTPPPLADVRGANVVVMVGPETAARLVAPTAGTPTTRPAATTATTTVATTATTRG